MKKMIIAALILAICLQVFLCDRAGACGPFFGARSTVRGYGDGNDIYFYFPLMPAGPAISDIKGVFLASDQIYYTVSAKIESGQVMESCCGENCDRIDCKADEWYARPNPSVVPNPPCIPNPKGYSMQKEGELASIAYPECRKDGNPLLNYYFDDDPEDTRSVTMIYNRKTGKFKGSIPLNRHEKGENLTYYIVAADSYGNVAAQVPDSNTAPCPGASTWNTAYGTPPTNNCEMMSGHELCGESKSGPPACGDGYTLNDPAGDTCGKPDDDGRQSVDSQLDHVDITGISAGAGKGYAGSSVFCAQIGLKAHTPTSSSGPIDAYMLFLFNPDVPDSDPSDTHLVNGFFAFFAPETEGVCSAAAEDQPFPPNAMKSDSSDNRDSSTNRVSLWDAGCITDPDNDDYSSCSIFGGIFGRDDKITLTEDENSLKLVVRNDLPGGRSLLGKQSRSVKMVFVSLAILLSGETPLWKQDETRGLTLIAENNTVTIEPPESTKTVHASGPFVKYRLEPCDYASDPVGCGNGAYKKVLAGVEGVSIEVCDADTGAVIASGITETDGTLADIEVDTVMVGVGYYNLRARFPAGTWDDLLAHDLDFGCESDSTSGECLITLSENVELLYSTLLTLDPIEIPDLSGGAGGGELGNTNCDGVVNISDLAPIKKSFGCSRGQSCYEPAADTNMDGAVNISDLAAIKKNFGAVLNGNPTARIATAALCAGGK